MEKDKSWQAPETAAFKNVDREGVPTSNYNHKGEKVGTDKGIPASNYTHKGENVGNKSGIPGTTSDEIVTYKGDKSAGRKSK